MPACINVFLAGLAVLLMPAQSPPYFTYRIDAASSRIELSVFREGLFKVFGHDHTIAAKSFSGGVRLIPDKMERSSVTLNIEAGSLIVLDPGTSDKERHDVKEAMDGAQVLDVERFPKIAFSSTGVSQLKKTDTDWEITLAGKLNLHGVEKPLTLPLRVHLEGDRLDVKGETYVSQTEFGMRPIKIAGGAVKVRDRVKISFAIVAKRSNL